jgi:sucrose-6-phosphate hydrolase SacC (GH32 family)
MKLTWKKLGRVFDPTEHTLSNNCVEFAQSPQALVFDDFVRIYFSTREKDRTGKYLSHISFVDMDKAFRSVIKISSKTVIELGGLGCFDEHGIFPMNVCRVQQSIYAYTTGWNRRASVSTDAAIGLAISTDGGDTFKKVGKGPVLGASLHEPFLVGDAFVALYRNEFHMWYIHGTKWTVPHGAEVAERVYKIAHATSPDGISWQKDNRQIVTDKLNVDECQALPTVIHFNGLYHMFFCYRYATDFRANKERAYRLGYAFSSNLIDWCRDDEDIGIDISPTGWDSDMMCYPHVFEMDGDIYLLYNGNEFGRFGFGVAKLEK